MTDQEIKEVNAVIHYLISLQVGDVEQAYRDRLERPIAMLHNLLKEETKEDLFMGTEF